MVSELVGKVSFMSGTAVAATIQRNYEARRDVVLTVENKRAGGSISLYGEARLSADRRFGG
jgi:hypothetical protein